MEEERPRQFAQASRESSNRFQSPGSEAHRAMDIERGTPSFKSDSKVGTFKIRREANAEKIDRSQILREIGIKVVVFKLNCFSTERIYFIESDTVIGQFCKKLRDDFNIMDYPKSERQELEVYKLFFDNMRLDEEKRFAELSLVSGDKFHFCPQFYAPKQATGRLTEYLDFVLNRSQNQSNVVSQQYFTMLRNEFILKPSFKELSRMSFYELGRVENFVVQNTYGRIEFLEPVDLR